MGIRKWFKRRRRYQRLVRSYLQSSRVEANSDTEAKALQEALLIKFRQMGLVDCIERATGFPYRLWSNFNLLKKALYVPRFQNEWVVDTLQVQPHYWENRVVGCRNPASDWLNTSGYTYPNDLTIGLCKWRDGQRHYVFVLFWMDGTLQVKGAEETFYGKLPEDAFLARDKVMLALLQAMEKPLPDEKDLLEKQRLENAIAVA